MMTSNEIGGIAWGIVFAWFLINRWGIDGDASIAMLGVALTIFISTTGYNWGKWIQKRRMEHGNE